jgi:deoxyhypusine monooxygenase
MTTPDYEKLKQTLTSTSVPLSLRFRALFTLKSLKTTESVDIISLAFNDSSVLLKHELAYVLGQMKMSYALPKLKSVLADTTQDAMVRHEAAEAIGAIGVKECIPFLQTYLTDAEVTVRETVVLAIDLLSYTPSSTPLETGYTSIDPAPASDAKTTPELQKTLMDTGLNLFERYRAMFALRNKGDTESVLALATGFADKSALFRHEIAYVFGQMQHPASVPSLITVLKNDNEEGMVRHEAAEALGSIATDECKSVLDAYRKDGNRVVRESCEVGLDMLEYEQSGEFQYAQPI